MCKPTSKPTQTLCIHVFITYFSSPIANCWTKVCPKSLQFSLPCMLLLQLNPAVLLISSVQLNCVLPLGRSSVQVYIILFYLSLLCPFRYNRISTQVRLYVFWRICCLVFRSFNFIFNICRPTFFSDLEISLLLISVTERRR